MISLSSDILPLVFPYSKSIQFTKIDDRMWWYFQFSTRGDYDSAIGSCGTATKILFCAISMYFAQFIGVLRSGCYMMSRLSLLGGIDSGVLNGQSPSQLFLISL